tara:strand:- start:1727 stop:3130 length:1404 start_codon:yes stop_codon:yes gene_type:complete
MSFDDLTLLSAEELSSMILKRELSPVEITQAYLNRIDKYKHLNAYITVDYDGALSAAKNAEHELSHGLIKGPLHGLPIAVKDQFEVKGMRTTLGGNIVDRVAKEDATAIRRLRDGGAIFLGKLNLSEYALGGNIQHPFGVPKNPWDITRQAGQSSSGSAVAVSASLCAAALGGDTAGSIRGPAAWCGIVGLRPTWGAVSRHGAFPMAWFMDTIGPMTKTVMDTAMIYSIIAGNDPKDIYTSKRPVIPFDETGSVKGLRIGIVRESIDNGMASDEVIPLFNDAMDVLKDAGIIIEDASLPLFESGGLIANTLSDVEAAHTHRHWLRTRPEDYDFATRRRLFAASLISGATYTKLSRFRVLMYRDVMSALDRFDAIITPAQAAGAPLIANETNLTSKEAVISQFFGLRSHRSPFNLSGVPAIAIPCGFTQAGLPVSIQVAARPFSENVLFQLGKEFQRLTNWHLSRPNM